MRRMYSVTQLSELIHGLIADGLLEDVDLSVKSIDADGLISGGEIIEKMSGYSFTQGTITGFTIDTAYAGVVKNGNKITFVQALSLTKTANDATTYGIIGQFATPEDILSKLYPLELDNVMLDFRKVFAIYDSSGSGVDVGIKTRKTSGGIDFYALSGLYGMVVDRTYYLRMEITFMLSDNLASA